MNRKTAILALLSLLPASFPQAQSQPASGKGIYIPKDLLDNDFEDNDSKWSYQRMACTDNLALFWAKEFGADINRAPDLDGHDMKVDQENLMRKLERFYQYFYHDLGFVSAGKSKADRYRMMVMLDYSLEGTAFGGDYDSTIGALWITPNRIQDRALNCIAHELGHSFQSQISCDGAGEAWGGCGFFEMTSQWMVWQVNPDWLTDENYHFEAFRQLTHKAFLHPENIYHSPFVVEYWAEKHGKGSIAELFRQGRVGEDPSMTYMRLNKLSQQEFCNEMMDCYQHLMNFDFAWGYRESRPYACTFSTPMATGSRRGWYRPEADHIPEDYGFNAIRLQAPRNGGTVKATVRATSPGNPLATAFVAVTEQDVSIYGTVSTMGTPRITLPRHTPIKAFYLIVMGAPHHHVKLDEEHPETYRKYPYEVKVSTPIQP